MYRPSVADRASCPKCTECRRGQFMDETSSSASQCKMCPVGQASVEGQCIEIEPFKHMNLITDFFFFFPFKTGQSCTSWNYVCNDLGPGCLQVHSSSDAAFCGRKLCQHINQIVPSEEVVAMQAYNLSSDLCAKKEIDFVKSAAASLDNSNETTRIECQECSIGGECRFGWCSTPFHDETKRCSVCKRGYYTKECIICPPVQVALVRDALIVSISFYAMICLLYMILLPSKNAMNGSSGNARKGLKVVGLTGVLVNQLQVAATVLANIHW
jgi:hypothetical protein